MLVTIAEREGVIVLVADRPPANALDLKLVEAIEGLGLQLPRSWC
jgi:hypothetical protein